MSPRLTLLLRLGDSALILGHRLSEWCGKAPVLEEDIALANTALDLIGQATNWLNLAAEEEGRGRSADDLAMLRDAWDFRCLLLVQQPNGDFAQTILRQFLFDAFHAPLLVALSASTDARIAAIAEKSAKEVAYHLDRSASLVVRLGDGTLESHGRMQAALERLWPFTGEMFTGDAADAAMVAEGLAPAPDDLRAPWRDAVSQTLAEATLALPESDFGHQGGRSGRRHSEHLGHLLAEMQWLQRAYPGAEW